MTRRTSPGHVRHSFKAASDIYAPVAGEIVAANADLGSAPEKVNADAFGAWMYRIKPDNAVTVLVKHVEMGQGTYTGLPTLVAEELDAAWSQVRVEGAPADEKIYNNLLLGPLQVTGGSTAMANSFEQYRQAGAAARR